MFERGMISKYLYECLDVSENNFFIVNSSRNVDLLYKGFEKYQILIMLIKNLCW